MGRLWGGRLRGRRVGRGGGANVLLVRRGACGDYEGGSIIVRRGG